MSPARTRYDDLLTTVQVVLDSEPAILELDERPDLVLSDSDSEEERRDFQAARAAVALEVLHPP